MHNWWLLPIFYNLLSTQFFILILITCVLPKHFLKTYPSVLKNKTIPGQYSCLAAYLGCLLPLLIPDAELYNGPTLITNSHNCHICGLTLKCNCQKKRSSSQQKGTQVPPKFGLVENIKISIQCSFFCVWALPVLGGYQLLNIPIGTGIWIL
jgi:hypothetical protein